MSSSVQRSYPIGGLDQAKVKMLESAAFRPIPPLLLMGVIQRVCSNNQLSFFPVEICEVHWHPRHVTERSESRDSLYLSGL